MSILSESISLRSWTKEKKTMPKQKNAAGKNPPKTKVAAIPRQAMRGVLRAREDGRQRVRKDSAEGGQYQEAAGLEERLIDDVASAGSSAAGTILRGSKRAVKRAAGQVRQQAARTDRVRKGAAQAVQRARRAAQVAQETAKRTAEIVRAGIKALWVAAHTLAAALAAGGMAVVAVILVICMVAMVAGSAFGIFFAAEPTGDGIGVTEAITELNGEYQEQLQEIEDGEEYDRQEIESNDGSYAIAWQDVLTVFASYVSGAEDGAPVAYLDEENLDRLRTTLWDMNEVDHRIEAQSHDVEVPGEEGNTSTETITETVLVIELTHRSPEEMRDEYDFNARQNEYLSLLLAEDTAPLWGELLGGFSTGGGEVMTPGSDASLADGRLQWPLPVPGTITSPQGYRTDPITSEVSYHSGTDIAVPEGTPILAAADGTVTIANGLDRLGRQLRLPRQAGPRRRADYSVRALLQHLCHGGPAGQSWAGHCLCGAYRPRNRTASAFRGAWVIGRAHAKKAMMANTMLPSVAAMTCSTLTLRCTSLAVGHRANHSCKRSPAAETSELHAAILPH